MYERTVIQKFAVDPKNPLYLLYISKPDYSEFLEYSGFIHSNIGYPITDEIIDLEPGKSLPISFYVRPTTDGLLASVYDYKLAKIVITRL